jgi:hypothetical protein
VRELRCCLGSPYACNKCPPVDLVQNGGRFTDTVAPRRMVSKSGLESFQKKSCTSHYSTEIDDCTWQYTVYKKRPCNSGGSNTISMVTWLVHYSVTGAYKKTNDRLGIPYWRTVAATGGREWVIRRQVGFATKTRSVPPFAKRETMGPL